MEGWRDGGMEGWRDGGWMDGWTDGRMDGVLHAHAPTPAPRPTPTPTHARAHTRARTHLTHASVSGNRSSATMMARSGTASAGAPTLASLRLPCN